MSVMDLVVSYEVSNRGTPVLICNGYKFGLRKAESNDVKKRWVCTRMSKGCRAVLLTVYDAVVRSNTEHNH
ncbi:unnamed protein product [Leptidea sinapis]|uniref:FLYWCH-type domain-containing protein n=1 Tax=Leptidea sinapis TaxID=189913 RepID=A0A5E4PZ43_9NEOP|nr:unnamed protein product [Leptidea sinapis]